MMNKEEKKSQNKKLEQEQLKIEKKFHKTPFGKFIKVLLILTIITMAVGIITAFTSNIFNLNESVFDFAGKCMKYSSISSFICMIVYCIFVPEIMGNKDDKE